jgi:hypothetical protein
MRTIRYENVALLTMAAIFSVVATVVLSGFLEPSQPPAVAAVEIGEPRDGRENARERGERPRGERPRGGAEGARAERKQAKRRRAERSREAGPAQQARPEAASEPQPAPLLPIPRADPDDDAGEPAEAADDAD